MGRCLVEINVIYLKKKIAVTVKRLLFIQAIDYAKQYGHASLHKLRDNQ